MKTTDAILLTLVLLYAFALQLGNGMLCAYLLLAFISPH
jgi:hypothetical protein